MSTITSTSSSITSSIPETERKSLCLRAPPTIWLPHLHYALKGAIHLLGDSWEGQNLPCLGGGSAHQAGLVSLEYCLGELVPPFSAFYIRRVEEPGCNLGAVAGAEESQSNRGLAAESAGPEIPPSLSLEQLPSQTPDRAGWRQLGAKSLAVGQGPAERTALLIDL